MLLSLRDPTCNRLGRAAFQQELFDAHPERRALHDLHSLIFCILSARVRFVRRFFGVVSSAHLVPCDLIGDRGDTSLERPCD